MKGCRMLGMDIRLSAAKLMFQWEKKSPFILSPKTLAEYARAGEDVFPSSYRAPTCTSDVGSLALHLHA